MGTEQHDADIQQPEYTICGQASEGCRFAVTQLLETSCSPICTNPEIYPFQLLVVRAKGP